MTPAHTDSPLRRSEAGIFRDAAQNQAVHHNDDEEERRQARRRTILTSGSETDASVLEQSETLKKCLQIYHENKISRDNAWSLSLIDTLSTLLDRHHKSLNNFTVAGSSLEASSKVYGLRVDSVHTDVLRMSAGLNARKFRENMQDDDDGVATGGEGGADPNSSAGTGVDPANAAAPKRKKRQRKAVATVTKNKDTLNARLDTVPLQDPVFGKLNMIVGSINASNRLMNNMLHTVDAELRLRMTHRFWDSKDIEDDCDFTLPIPLENIREEEFLPCERLCRVERLEKLLLRPANSGYLISDTPEPAAEDKDEAMPSARDDIEERDHGAILENGADLFAGRGDTSMAFDINAECEPLPQLDSYAPIVAVDEQDYDEYTAEEHNAIGHCRGLRKAAVVIEDMRPIDSTTNLEYSYRPVEKISQFWAGPSHWRFRRTRHRSTMGQNSNNQIENVGRTLHTRNRRANALTSKKRLKVHFDGPEHDTQFIKLDSKYKARKTNFQKKWDQRKLRLPTDLQLKPDLLVNKSSFAPALSLLPANNEIHSDYEDGNELQHGAPSSPIEEQHFTNNNNNDEANEIFDPVHATMTANDVPEHCADSSEHLGGDLMENTLENHENNPANDTVLEIATDFENAPRQVTKIIVPFAKRAKVIDMKNLKRTCSQLITKQMQTCAVDESQIPTHPVAKNEHYAKGLASFQEIYKELPHLLSKQMAEGLTTSIALYSVLHLANDFNFRLIPQDDLTDFKIRQVIDE